MKNLAFASLTLLIVCFSTGRAQWRAQYAGLPAGVTTKQLYFAAVDAATCWAVPVNDAAAHGTYIRTTNGGVTWTSATVAGASSVVASSMAAWDRDHAWILFDEPSRGGGIYGTSNGGSVWFRNSAAFSGAGAAPRFIHFFDATNGLAVGNPTEGYWEIYTSTDGGINWTRVPSAHIPAPLPGEVAYIGGEPESYGNTFWFPTSQQSIYRSTDRGLTWTVSRNVYPGAVGMGMAFKDSLNGLISGDAGGNNGFRRTTDGGVTWTQVNKPANINPGFITYVPGTRGTYIASSFDVFPGWIAGSAYTTDDGNTWTPIDSKNHGRTAFISPTVGWSGGGNDSLHAWDTTGYAEAMVPVLDDPPHVPAGFALEQNYPNPFNPATVIRWQMAMGSHVSLRVYDILGREVAVLVDERKEPGSYEVRFGATGLSSGAYIYRLTAGDFTQTRTMLLLK